MLSNLSPLITFFEEYGWYVLFAFVGILWLSSKFLPNIEEYFRKREDKQYAAKYHKDVDMVNKRLNQQQAHIEKLQEKYKKDAEEYKKKMEDLAQKKREAFLERTESSGGHKLGGIEYNPLMGSGGNSYRPQRKTPCSGGGCGKR